MVVANGVAMSRV